MSRSRTRRPVLTEFQRRAIDVELRRRVASCLPELRRLNHLDGDAAAELLVSDVPVSELVAPLLNVAAPTVRRDGLDILGVEIDVLKSAASEAGIATARIEQVVRKLDDLVAAEPTVDVEQLSMMTDEVISEIKEVEASIIDDLCDARALELAGAAAAEALRRVGLHTIAVTIDGGELTITGISESGQRAELEVSSSNVLLTVDDPADAVHPLHPAAGQICEGAAELAERIHLAIPDMFAGVGLDTGPVEIVDAPTRGSAMPTSRSRPNARRARRGTTR